MTLTIEEKIKFFSSAIAEFHTLTFLEQFRLLFSKVWNLQKTSSICCPG